MSDTSTKDMAELQKRVGNEGVLDALERNAKAIPLNGSNHRNGRNGVQSRSTTGKLPDIIDIMDFLGKPLPKPSELIKGILHKGSKLILSGASKSRKTWALTHMAICIAAGQPWWGFETTPGRVLYANFEIAPEFFQDRVNAIKEYMGLEGRKLKGQLDLWNLRGNAAPIEDLADQIIEQTKDKYSLVILDPMYKILGNRDENSNSDVAVMMNVFDRIIKETGTGIAFAHHFSKGNQARREAMDRMSGAGAFARDADSLLTMTKHEQPDTYVVETILRNHKPQEPFCVTLDHPIMERWDGADPNKLKTVNGRQKKCFVTDLVKLFGGEELRRTDLKQRFIEAKLGSDGTFNNLFREARDTEKIEECDNGRKWRESIQKNETTGTNEQPEGGNQKVQ